MEDYSVDIELADDLEIEIDAEDQIEIEIDFAGQAADCPIIYEIDGGDSGDDSQFQSINGLLDGGNS